MRSGRRKENQKKNHDEGVILFSKKMGVQGKMVIPSLSMKVMELRKWVFDDPFSLFQ